MEPTKADLAFKLIDLQNERAQICKILGVPFDSSMGRIRDRVAELKALTPKTEKSHLLSDHH